jgi:methionine synthase I (cobalamin-dependent)
MRRKGLKALLSAAAVGLLAVATPVMAAQKVIFDTDFNSMGDDGQAFVMLVQAMREQKIDLLGMTVVTGNRWLDQEVAEALRAVERLGVADKVGVYPGAVYPLLREQKTELDIFPLYSDTYNVPYSSYYAIGLPGGCFSRG